MDFCLCKRCDALQRTLKGRFSEQVAPVAGPYPKIVCNAHVASSSKGPDRHPLKFGSQVELLLPRPTQVNPHRDEVLGKEWRLYPQSQTTAEDGGQMASRPYSLAWMLVSFMEPRGKVKQ